MLSSQSREFHKFYAQLYEYEQSFRHFFAKVSIRWKPYVQGDFIFVLFYLDA